MGIYGETVRDFNVYSKNVDLSKYYPEEILNEVKIQENGKKVGILSNCTIEVRGNEGVHPHIHIFNFERNICLCLFIPMYFKHPGYKDELKNFELKALDKYFREKMKNESYTNWQFYAMQWKIRNNPLINWKDPFATEQPDYTKTSGSVHD